TYQGRAYKLERAGAVPAGKTQSFLLGATHGGIPVRFHFAASAETVPPASALDDPALKARLLRHLGATLYKQPKTTGPNPAPLELKK
ncbi:MAG TPA: hypothetical protein VG733_19420, partial [Chthoniobacteraceae bacterium]|nr:hypothetical protein [Chthoniobacteraceae bacterium]